MLDVDWGYAAAPSQQVSVVVNRDKHAAIGVANHAEV
jgi:hypothetical protein